MNTTDALIDNRRTMCAHCSLRQDLPGFISREHAQGNADQIAAGDIFQCHMIRDHMVEAPPHRACLGAAKVAQAPLLNTPTGLQPPVYEDLDTYVETQAAGRKSRAWLQVCAEQWFDRRTETWYGWWEQAPAGNWHYLMTTLEDNANDSVYLFFDQCEEMFGPLENARRIDGRRRRSDD